MSELTNTEVDAQVLNAIGIGKNRSYSIGTSVLGTITEANYRLIDKALVRLKRKKKIEYDSKTGWKLIKEDQVPTEENKAEAIPTPPPSNPEEVATQ